jgi:hypothetical protein
MCKPWKANGYSELKSAKPRDARRMQFIPEVITGASGYGPPYMEALDNPRAEVLDAEINPYDCFETDGSIDPEVEELLVIDFFPVMGGGRSLYARERK